MQAQSEPSNQSSSKGRVVAQHIEENHHEEEKSHKTPRIRKSERIQHQEEEKKEEQEEFKAEMGGTINHGNVSDNEREANGAGGGLPEEERKGDPRAAPPRFNSNDAPSAGSGEQNEVDEEEKKAELPAIAENPPNAPAQAQGQGQGGGAKPQPGIVPEEAKAGPGNSGGDDEEGVDGVGPSSDVDSLLNPRMGEDYNLSDLEEDNEFEAMREKGVECESDDSHDSDIPDEHENGYGYNEYMRRYQLNIRAITWNRDSQGLFDYETRHCQKQKLTTDKPCTLVRVGQTCKVHDVGHDLAKAYQCKYQVLANIKKIRNHYLIEPSDIAKIASLSGEERKAFMAKDVDQQYAETGEQLNEPCDTFEKIYLIVRNITNRNVKQEYVLKKHDIVKLGRVKFKVKEIHIARNDEDRQMKQHKLKRREFAWIRKELHRMKAQH